jgi:hypothetical protein
MTHEFLLAYVGLGPGQELIPYFLTLLGFMSMALFAVLQWPMQLVMRLFRKVRGTPSVDSKTHPSAEEMIAQPAGANAPETLGENGHGKP